MMKKLFILIFLILSFSQNAFCQYLPIGILPMEYNPSFAGSVGDSRIVSNFSYFRDSYNNDQDLHTGGGFDVSYDKYYPAIRSGVGVIISGGYSSYNGRWRQGKRWLTSIDLVVAPKISLKGKYTISPSIDIKYVGLYQNQDDEQHRYGDVFGIKSGILFNASHYYIGYSIEYYFKNYYLNTFSDLTTAFQFGYTFQKNIDSKFSFTPQFALPILIDSGVDIYWPSYNLSFRYGSFILGAISQFAYEYPTGFQVGWQNNAWRVLLSNNFKDINNNYTDQYTANFTLRYIFNHDKQSRNILY